MPTVSFSVLRFVYPLTFVLHFTNFTGRSRITCKRWIPRSAFFRQLERRSYSHDVVNDAIARNCTGISPCQQDTTIIRDAEIEANIVNECGRTELTGNIDVGENTENALAAGAVTAVKAGTKMTVTIHQVNADGAGPYVCDIDETGKSMWSPNSHHLIDRIQATQALSRRT